MTCTNIHIHKCFFLSCWEVPVRVLYFWSFLCWRFSGRTQNCGGWGPECRDGTLSGWSQQ